ncbi:hypothetical protein HHI36_006376 [Cryptolaemus montrouzieri]|uniref:Uncharacterized protein n=1 Tax=Cryptolaemus montrouzieri TaxID=559131 RepID=A0ABD2NWV7_9CUCU
MMVKMQVRSTYIIYFILIVSLSKVTTMTINQPITENIGDIISQDSLITLDPEESTNASEERKLANEFTTLEPELVTEERKLANELTTLEPEFITYTEISEKTTDKRIVLFGYQTNVDISSAALASLGG